MATAAFEDFLRHFKTSRRSTTSHSIHDMNIDDDDFSDEYDFVDSDDEAAETRRTARQQARRPKIKYLELLQDVADRTQDEITIDLDDLALVGLPERL